MKKVPAPRWQLAVYVMIKDTRGRVLVLRRSNSARNFPGLWELPGGKPANGERFNKTAELEVMEETGLYVPPSGVAGAAEAQFPDFKVALLVLEGRAPSTRIALSDEHDAYRWVPPAQLASVRWRPGFGTFVKSYLAANRKSPPRRRS